MIKESAINRIDALVEKVNEIVDDGDEFKGYKASPLLKEILDLLEENSDKEQDTLEVQYDAYRFVADIYKMMGRFSLAAKYHEKALDASIVGSNAAFIVILQIPQPWMMRTGVPSPMIS